MALYRIADVVVDMDCTGSLLIKRATPYLSTKDVVADVVIKRDDNWISNSVDKNHNLNEEEWEYMFFGSEFYRELLKYDGMLLHASAVVVDGKAYLFSAKSKTGKSTHTSLWLEMFGDKAYIINDDKPAIRFVDGKFYVYGTPFSGKHDLSRNTRCELGGICFLAQAPENKISKMDINDVIFNMLSQTLRHISKDEMDMLLLLMDKLLRSVGVYMLECNMDISAAKLSYETMSGEKL